MPKQIRVRWSEVTTYEATITVPDDYPETIDACLNHDETRTAYPKSGSGEDDWWERVDHDCPDWPTNNLLSVEERELLEVEVVAKDVQP